MAGKQHMVDRHTGVVIGSEPEREFASYRALVGVSSNTPSTA